MLAGVESAVPDDHPADVVVLGGPLAAPIRTRACRVHSEGLGRHAPEPRRRRGFGHPPGR